MHTKLDQRQNRDRLCRFAAFPRLCRAEAGSSKAIGIDIDPQAIFRPAAISPERNGVFGRLSCTCRESTQPEAMKADVKSPLTSRQAHYANPALLISVPPVEGGLPPSGPPAAESAPVMLRRATPNLRSSKRRCRITGRKNNLSACGRPSLLQHNCPEHLLSRDIIKFISQMPRNDFVTIHLSDVNSCYQRTKVLAFYPPSHRPRVALSAGVPCCIRANLSSMRLKNLLRLLREHKSASVRPLPTDNGEKSRASGK